MLAPPIVPTTARYQGASSSLHQPASNRLIADLEVPCYWRSTPETLHLHRSTDPDPVDSTGWFRPSKPKPLSLPYRLPDSTRRRSYWSEWRGYSYQPQQPAPMWLRAPEQK